MRIRRQHVIRSTNERPAPQRWLFFDTESEQRVTQHFIALPMAFGYALYAEIASDGSIYERDLMRFDCTEELRLIIERYARGKGTLHVVAYNIQHDLACTRLVEAMIATGWDVKYLYVNNTTLILRMGKDQRTTVTFLDGLNWFRGSLESWSKLVGIDKITVKWDQVDHAALEQRCINDVRILAHMIAGYVRFTHEHHLGAFARTISGQAWNAWRNRFMTEKVCVHNDEQVLKLERAAYIGGMVRVWRVGYYNTGTYYRLDVNSLYPYVMATYEYPVELKRYGEGCSVKHLGKLLDNGCVIADCTVHPKFPFYPRRTNVANLYPCYRFRGVFCTPELLNLIREGAIEQVHRVALYRAGRPFTQYVDALYNLRRQMAEKGNKIYERMVKLLLNSLYGRFGCHTSQMVRLPDCDGMRGQVDMFLDREHNTWRRVYFIGNEAYILSPEREGYESVPAIAAHVTAYGRCHMRTLLERIPAEHRYYTDTDSIITDVTGMTVLEDETDPTMLGYLKVEDTTQEIAIYARKDYKFGSQRILKGIPIAAQQLDDCTYVREQWTGLLATWGAKADREYGIELKPIRLNRNIYDGEPDEEGIVRPFTQPPWYDENPSADPLSYTPYTPLFDTGGSLT